MTLISDLRFNGYASVLLRYPSAYGDGPGELALWVRDDYQAGKAEKPGTYSLCDIDECSPLTGDEDIGALVEEWKRVVGWGATTEEG